MKNRKRVVVKEHNYFVGEKTNYKFVSTGCSLLDCALGGGYPVGRIVNIVGDKSTAKTALATEALINFTKTYPKGTAAYRDAEAAFDLPYAAAMGLEVNKVDFGNKEEPINTVEEFARDLKTFMREKNKSHPGIYVLDSLDALSDEAEMKMDFGEATYGTGKAKMLSILFRKLTRELEQSNTLLLIVSQVRENIGAMFGEKYKRSGGKGLDHNCSQIIWLAHLKELKRTVSKVERPYAIRISAKIKKNKVGLALRKVEFDFVFGYGIDDVGASVDWLDETGFLEASVKEYKKYLESCTDEEYNLARTELALQVKEAWREVETSFLPKRKKYNA